MTQKVLEERDLEDSFSQTVSLSEDGREKETEDEDEPEDENEEEEDYGPSIHEVQLVKSVKNLLTVLFPSLKKLGPILETSKKPATEVCDRIILFVQQVETSIAQLKEKRKGEKGSMRKRLGQQMGKLQAKLVPEIDFLLLELSPAQKLSSRMKQLRLLQQSLLTVFKGGLSCQLLSIC